MIRVDRAAAAACVLFSLVGAGCASSTSPYPVASAGPYYTSNGCPPRTAKHCDARHGGGCRCVSDRAMRDFMRTLQ